MSTIIRLITQFNTVIIISLLLISCNRNHHSISGSGHVTTEKRIMQDNFKSIEVSNAIDVIIEQSDKTEIIVEADNNIQSTILTKVKNGVLIISRESGNYTNIKSQKVIVKMPIIEELCASSASSITTANTLKGQNIDLVASSAAKIDAHLEIDHIVAKSSSASKININGLALDLDADASSASKIEASDLLTNNVIAKSSSGAKISVHPIVSLNAQASSGSKIKYNNNPKHIDNSTLLGGKIELE